MIFDLENEQIAIVTATCSEDPNRVRIDKSITTNSTVTHVYVNSADQPVQVGHDTKPFTYPTIPDPGSSSDLSMVYKIILFGLVLLVFVLLICVCRYCCKEGEEREKL